MQEENETVRGIILETAKKLTEGDRNKAYGPPVDNLAETAGLFYALSGHRLTPYECALFCVALKFARMRTSKNTADHYIDAAAYLAIAYECLEAEAKEPNNVG